MNQGNHNRAKAPAFLAVACVGFLVSAPALAEDRDEDLASDEQQIIVEGQLEHAEAESAKATAPLLDTPQTVTIVSDQVIRKQNLLTLRDVLATIPGIGPIIATAIAATVTEPGQFRSGREFAAWLGLVPRQNSTGGKTRLGGISKRGNQYLRRLLINGASANLLRSRATKADPWVIGLRRRRPSLVVAVALANKTARIAWAVMQRQQPYQRMAAAA